MKPVCVLLLLCMFAGAAPAAQSPDAALSSGYDAMYSGRYKEAMTLFREANARAHGHCGECYYAIALLYKRVNDLRFAAEYAGKALAYAADPQLRAQAYELRGATLASQAGTDRRRLEKAREDLSEAVKLVPGDPKFHLNLGIVLLRLGEQQEGEEELKACLGNGASPHDAAQATRVLQKPALAGLPLAPDFTLTTLQGETYSADSLQGKFVVMDFWATWCHSCVAALGDMRDLVRRYSGRVVVLSVSEDNNEQTWHDFVQRQKMDWPQYFDRNRSLIEAFGVRAFPTYCVVDPDGVIRKKIVGSDPHLSLAGQLKQTLAEMPELR